MDHAKAMDDWRRFREALKGAALPAALVDLDALEHNVDGVVRAARAADRKLRIATKSVRCRGLLTRILERAGDAATGLMTMTGRETEWLARHGFGDLLCAYPAQTPADRAALARANALGAIARVVVDDEAALPPLAEAARSHGTRIPVVIDLDVSLRVFGGRVHVGVQRSPVRSADAAVRLATAIAREPALSLVGLMGYEAHVAGLPDQHDGARWRELAVRLLKRVSGPRLVRLRGEVTGALLAAGFALPLVNGGGSGSLSLASDPSLTEVTVGSAFLASHLFSRYSDLPVRPASYFALPIVRRPAPDLVTCLGGGLVASGAVGSDRWPVPALPAGLTLLPLEGAGEVQTPLRVPHGLERDLALGEPIFFRHAKAGELAEHFAHYALVRGDHVVERVATYRGDGQCFLGS